jgi:hypothetical protein
MCASAPVLTAAAAHALTAAAPAAHARQRSGKGGQSCVLPRMSLHLQLHMHLPLLHRQRMHGGEAGREEGGDVRECMAQRVKGGG